MDKTIQDELREICEEKECESWHCHSCWCRGEGCLTCRYHVTADTLLAALDARGLEIRRKGE